MTKSILLIGLGRFGRHVAMKLDELHHEIMAVDKEERRVEAALPYVTNAQIGDATNEAFLSSLGVSNFDVCIVAIGDNFQSSLEATSLDEHAIFEVTIPEEWVGKTVGQLDIRKKYKINIMALKEDGQMDLGITPGTLLSDDATMLVLGNIRDIERCFKL